MPCSAALSREESTMVLPTAPVAVEQQPRLKRAGSQLHRLTCAAQNYAWGKHFEDSEVRTWPRGWPTARLSGVSAVAGAPRQC